VGKTRCAIEIAKRFGGEIVSADAMQIYRGLDIGSAKPSAKERAEAPHHLIGFADPAREFSVATYQKLARATVADIAARGRLPVVAGGTGLYVNALLHDMDFSAPPRQGVFRRELEHLAETRGAAFLHGRLRALDGAAADRIHPNNLKKVIRALEILGSEEAEGRGGAGRRLRPFSEAFSPWPEYAPCVVGLTRKREELYERIDARVDALMEAGLAAEVRALMEAGLSEAHISMKGIGYKELLSCFRGDCDLDQAVALIKRNSRRYAKRQLTWFKRLPGIRWFDLSGPEDGAGDALREIFAFIASFYEPFSY
jgi:tRNA dimethylallyltransferase